MTLYLEPDARAALITALGSMMSDWCQETYCAGWLLNWEEQLPHEIRQWERTGVWEQGGRNNETENVHEQFAAMASLAGMLGHWVKAKYTEEGRRDRYEPYTPECDREASTGDTNDERTK